MTDRPSPLTSPRGRLPARVYWVRRGLVLGTAVALVFAFAHLLGGGGGDTPSAKAELSSAGRAAGATQSRPPATAGPYVVATGKAKAKKSTAAAQPVLAAPDGPCAADEVSVEPVVSDARAGGPVTIQVKLTATRPACTFSVSPKALAVKVTSGSDRVWSSQDCRAAVPKSSVVVRSAVPAVVPVTWNGRRSDGSCSASNAWARPGYYHALAAVIGSEPGDTQFKLALPSRPVVTKTAKPKTKKTAAKAGSTKSTPKKSEGAQGKGSVCGGDNSATSC